MTCCLSSPLSMKMQVARKQRQLHFIQVSTYNKLMAELFIIQNEDRPKERWFEDRHLQEVLMLLKDVVNVKIEAYYAQAKRGKKKDKENESKKKNVKEDREIITGQSVKIGYKFEDSYLHYNYCLMPAEMGAPVWWPDNPSHGGGGFEYARLFPKKLVVYVCEYRPASNTNSTSQLMKSLCVTPPSRNLAISSYFPRKSDPDFVESDFTQSAIRKHSKLKKIIKGMKTFGSDSEDQSTVQRVEQFGGGYPQTKQEQSDSMPTADEQKNGIYCSDVVKKQESGSGYSSGDNSFDIPCSLSTRLNKKVEKGLLSSVKEPKELVHDAKRHLEEVEKDRSSEILHKGKSEEYLTNNRIKQEKIISSQGQSEVKVAPPCKKRGKRTAKKNVSSQDDGTHEQIIRKNDIALKGDEEALTKSEPKGAAEVASVHKEQSYVADSTREIAEVNVKASDSESKPSLADQRYVTAKLVSSNLNQKYSYQPARNRSKLSLKKVRKVEPAQEADSKDKNSDNPSSDFVAEETSSNENQRNRSKESSSTLKEENSSLPSATSNAEGDSTSSLPQIPGLECRTKTSSLPLKTNQVIRAQPSDTQTDSLSSPSHWTRNQTLNKSEFKGTIRSPVNSKLSLNRNQSRKGKREQCKIVAKNNNTSSSDEELMTASFLYPSTTTNRLSAASKDLHLSDDLSNQDQRISKRKPEKYLENLDGVDSTSDSAAIDPPSLSTDSDRREVRETHRETTSNLNNEKNPGISRLSPPPPLGNVNQELCIARVSGLKGGKSSTISSQSSQPSVRTDTKKFFTFKKKPKLKVQANIDLLWDWTASDDTSDEQLKQKLGQSKRNITNHPQQSNTSEPLKGVKRKKDQIDADSTPQTGGCDEASSPSKKIHKTDNKVNTSATAGSADADPLISDIIDDDDDDIISIETDDDCDHDEESKAKLEGKHGGQISNSHQDGEVIDLSQGDDYDSDHWFETTFGDIRYVRDLKEDDVVFLIRKNKTYLKRIFQGKMTCERHQCYKQKGTKRLGMAGNVRLGPFRDEHMDAVMGELVKVYCRKNFKYMDYLSKVLLPEALTKIYMDVHNVNHSHAEEVMRGALQEEPRRKSSR